MIKFFAFYFGAVIGFTLFLREVWMRFIRERTLRNIPDLFMTEFRIFLLLYICCVYLVVIIFLIKKQKTVSIFTQWSKIYNDFLFIPLKYLDHLIKYNKYIKSYYFSFMKLLAFKVKPNNIKYLILLFQIFPRVILVAFLLADTFYFNKLEMLYKIILVGLIPFAFRYYKYSLKDFKEKSIEELGYLYGKVWVQEKGYENTGYRSGGEREDGSIEAPWHCSAVSVKEYVEGKFEILISKLKKETTHDYIGQVYFRVALGIDTEHDIELYNNIKTTAPKSYSEKINKNFNDFIDVICDLELYLICYSASQEKKIIKWPRVAIFCMYLLCWSFILIFSFYHFPIEFKMLKIFILKFCLYNVKEENYFISIQMIEENLFTKDHWINVVNICFENLILLINLVERNKDNMIQVILPQILKAIIIVIIMIKTLNKVDEIVQKYFKFNIKEKMKTLLIKIMNSIIIRCTEKKRHLERFLDKEIVVEGYKKRIIDRISLYQYTEEFKPKFENYYTWGVLYLPKVITFTLGDYFISGFLNNINWKEIITQTEYYDENLIENIFRRYLHVVYRMEIEVFSRITEDLIIHRKNQGRKALLEHVSPLMVNANEDAKKTIIQNTEELMGDEYIHWVSYLLTKDCDDEDFNLLKESYDILFT